MTRVRLLVGLLALAASCAPLRAAPLSLERFFRGQLSANGVVENLRDGTRRPFDIAMSATWKGPVGTLVQDIAFADGEKQHRIWTFTKVAEGRFVGRREDLTRDADVVEDADGVHMTYKADTRLPSGLSLNLSFDDRLAPLSENTVSARSDISYLFVSAARLSMTITRLRAK